MGACRRIGFCTVMGPIALLRAAPSHAAPPNLLRDPGFESAPNNQPDRWTTPKYWLQKTHGGRVTFRNAGAGGVIHGDSR